MSFRLHCASRHKEGGLKSNGRYARPCHSRYNPRKSSSKKEIPSREANYHNHPRGRVWRVHLEYREQSYGMVPRPGLFSLSKSPSTSMSLLGKRVTTPVYYSDEELDETPETEGAPSSSTNGGRKRKRRRRTRRARRAEVASSASPELSTSSILEGVRYKILCMLGFRTNFLPFHALLTCCSLILLTCQPPALPRPPHR